MKNLKATLLTAVGAVVFSLAVTASADSVQAGYGTVVRVQGLASYSLGDGQRHPLIAGKTLPAGATVYTGDNGIVDIVLGKTIQFPQAIKVPDRIASAPDSNVRGLIGYTPASEQNVIRLNFNTTLTIDKLTTSDNGVDAVGDTELNLQKGRIYTSVKKISPTSQYIVKLPNGVAGIRGTKCSISADGVVAVFESSSSGVFVTLTGTDNIPHTFLVAPGQMLDLTRSNEPLTLPPSLIQDLASLFNSLQTTYIITVNVTGNTATVYISPGSGTLSGQPQ